MLCAVRDWQLWQLSCVADNAAWRRWLARRPILSARRYKQSTLATRVGRRGAPSWLG